MRMSLPELVDNSKFLHEEGPEVDHHELFPHDREVLGGVTRRW
jgi:hypothetical protein